MTLPPFERLSPRNLFATFAGKPGEGGAGGRGRQGGSGERRAGRGFQKKIQKNKPLAFVFAWRTGLKARHRRLVFCVL